jgi:hypothetical protein
MSNPISALTELAIEAVGLEPDPMFAEHLRISTADSILQELLGLSLLQPNKLVSYKAARQALTDDPDMATVIPIEGQADPMFMTVAGGSRASLDLLLNGLIVNSIRLLRVTGVDITDNSLTRSVLEGYEELKRAVRGEQVRSYVVRGLAGITLAKDTSVNTPWGVIRGIEPSEDWRTILPYSPFVHQSTALLVTPVLTAVAISREANPQGVISDQQYLDDLMKQRILTPLLFACLSPEGARRAPIITFETLLTPFVQSFGYSTPYNVSPFVAAAPVEKGDVKKLEGLAKNFSDLYHDNLQIPSTRIVSAISQRIDKVDALIDAVTAWEGLVGTRSETVYRVTASLANLLEKDPQKRQAFRKSLEEVYEIRSRVVHGNVVDQGEVAKKSDIAIDIAIRAVLELYDRGGDWLGIKSEERSGRLLLGY